ncbi:hypothetical protein [Flavimaricola marinus]|uniref:Uncharacterized protein n=1 Tax=Flavimaricola marinus TaxID=1819565 RepID=A0A238LDA2_9RHOB|nr:hypothetical protein [Flavimaricola marinus]SMY07562.1 hypothetical protein LOM8899_01698 [Flavimaricola marinus]
MSSQSSLFDGIKHNMALALSFLPRKTETRRVTPGAQFEMNQPAAEQDFVAEAPLPPCKPLNKAERSEAEMLARIRGALYAKDS